jgi:hypothetical protein
VTYAQDNGEEAAYYHPQQDFTLKEKMQYSLLGIIVVGGAVIFGRNWIRHARSNSEERKTLDEGNAPTLAKQIKMAFDNDGWFGTDKDALRLAIRTIPSKSEFRKVMVSYQKLYNSSLLGDMQKELKSSEYNEMLYIVSAKPESHSANEPRQLTTADLQGWAKRLNAAFNIYYGPFPGTDEPAIKAVFLEIPTQEMFQQVAAVYQSLYGNDLIADLKSELELWEYDPMIQIINSKPKN